MLEIDVYEADQFDVGIVGEVVQPAPAHRAGAYLDDAQGLRH
jgi:hypothetical protein